MAGGARSKMVWRAAVSRKVKLPERLAWGQQEHDEVQVHSDLPCYIWADDDRIQYGDAKIAVLTAYRMIVPAGSDITLDDKVTAVQDRRGQAMFGELVAMEVVSRAEIPGSHIELVLNGVR